MISIFQVSLVSIRLGSSSFPFKGSFQGNGHTISNISYSVSYYDNNVDHVGLFTYLGEGASINATDDEDNEENRLFLDNIHVSLDGEGASVACYIGTFAGKAEDAVEIRNISILNSSVVVENCFTGWAGGLAGSLTTSSSSGKQIKSIYIKESSFEASTNSSNSYAGGVAAYVYSNIAGTDYFNSIQLYNNTVNSDNYAGGFAGKIQTGNNSSGFDFEFILISAEDTSVSGADYSGGFSGMVSGSGTQSFNNTVVKGLGVSANSGGSGNAGGFFSSASSTNGITLKGSYAQVSVDSNNYAGCLFSNGDATLSIENSYANCASVVGSTLSSYFEANSSATVDATSTFYTSPDGDEGLSATYITIDEISDEDYMSDQYPNFQNGDPWLWVDENLPRTVMEIYPEYFFL